MNVEYLRPGFDFALAHAVEECGEVLAAAGKCQRWGRYSTNPELPVAERETNEAWLRREVADLRGALDRLDAAIEPNVAELVAEAEAAWPYPGLNGATETLKEADLLSATSGLVAIHRRLLSEIAAAQATNWPHPENAWADCGNLMEAIVTLEQARAALLESTLP